jgi:hypothetical protein
MRRKLPWALVPSALAAFLLTSCEQPFERSPPGFVDACHGGIGEWARNWVCSERRQVVTLEGTDQDWPRLDRLLKELGTREQLKVFGGIDHHPGYIRILEVQLCSAEGLYLSVDDRIYDNETFNREPGTIEVVLRTYKDDFDWKPLASRLSALLESEWGGEMTFEYPPPRGNDRALPDSIKSCDP